MHIVYSPHFARRYKKLPRSVKLAAEQKERAFRKNPFDPALRTHRLKGRLRGLWSFSINQEHRIVFEFAEGDTVYFHDAGDHRVYQ
jgi:mRNA-degrading endonuclease YafQ of YafQ-DinJ toxin-antitoxin module